MLIDERPRLFYVALDADLILRRGGEQIFVAIGRVRVVAVGAYQQALVHLVWKGMANCDLMSVWHWKQSVAAEP